MDFYCPHLAYTSLNKVLNMRLLHTRKRPRKEQQQEEEEDTEEGQDEDKTASATPKRRAIKLNSVKELRAEISDNTHKGMK